MSVTQCTHLFGSISSVLIVLPQKAVQTKMYFYRHKGVYFGVGVLGFYDFLLTLFGEGMHIETSGIPQVFFQCFVQLSTSIYVFQPDDMVTHKKS